MGLEQSETMGKGHEAFPECLENKGHTNVSRHSPELNHANGTNHGSFVGEHDGAVNRTNSAVPNECFHRPMQQQNYFFCSAFHPNLPMEMQNQSRVIKSHFYTPNHGHYINWFPCVPFQMQPSNYPHEFYLQDFQYFVVIDFEATCDKEKNPHPQEIIEFPSVLVNSRTGQLEDCFQMYVRPTHNQLLSDFCKELTGIQQSQVDKGVLLSEAILMHDKWLEDKGIKHTNFAVVTWSNWDCRVMLESECRFKKIWKPPYFNRWINLKVPFNEVFGGVKCNLKEAVQLAGLTWEGRAHCGLDDAKNTARLVSHLMHRGFKFSITNSLLWQSADHPCKMQQRVPAPECEVHKWKNPFFTVVPLPPVQGNLIKEQSLYCFCGMKSIKRMLPGSKNGSFFFGCGNWTATRGALCPYFKWAISESANKPPCFAVILFLSTSCLSGISATNEFCEAGIGYGESGSRMSSSSKILIKGGTVVNAHHQVVADVYIEDGIIVAVRPNIRQVDVDAVVLDAAGKFVMPGGIDPHTHLGFEFMGTKSVDDFSTGQAAALAGGTTMNIDFIIPIDGSLSAGYKAYEEKTKDSVMDYGFHVAVTKWDEDVSREMDIMVKEKGINSFKFFMAHKGVLMLDDEQLLEGIKKCKSLGALAMVHAENGDAVVEGQKRMIELGITGPEGHDLSRPALLEAEATGRAIRLASFVNTPLYVVHVMSSDAMEEIAKARQSGQKVVGEVLVSGLVLNNSGLWDPDFTIAAKYVMSPPIRAAGHDKALQAALSTGVLQLVGTDHCGFNSTQKAFGIDDFRKIPNGLNGIEERMHLVWHTMVESGQMSPTDYVRATSTECAKIFNIYPRKGAILAGSDADLIILNPNSSFKITAKSHHTKSDTNAFEGMTGKGKVEVTIAGGRIVWANGELRAVPGSGKFIKMPPFGYLFRGIDKADANYLSASRAPVKRFTSSA
ncbi:hypothetical protein Nepgr_001829 [Nepenthes gracilis]|uniref:dihydropyrimidinase n=1 Tax=Nepenthes gracilis TaxID=150966 RepID=A0AAD3RY18_NEPGR|nr:hypothetical protein Nepgr_001829 [Nepenthes gracilis]